MQLAAFAQGGFLVYSAAGKPYGCYHRSQRIDFSKAFAAYR
jgi:hypothetical protein